MNEERRKGDSELRRQSVDISQMRRNWNWIGKADVCRVNTLRIRVLNSQGDSVYYRKGGGKSWKAFKYPFPCLGEWRWCGINRSENDRARNKLGNRRVILQIHNLGLYALPSVWCRWFILAAIYIYTIYYSDIYINIYIFVSF